MSKKDTLADRMQSACRLRGIRENAGLTQEQFAEALGISASAYKKVESGENNISLSSLRNLHSERKVSADYILFGEVRDLEDVWGAVLNCSEKDKLFVLLRLLIYFTEIKKSTYPAKDNKSNEEQELWQLIYKLQSERKTHDTEDINNRR